MPPAGLRSRKTAHRRGVAEWLDPGVRQLDKNHCEAVRRQRARLRDASTKHQPMEPARRREIGQDDCRVVEPSDHRRSPQIEGSLRPEVEVGGSPRKSLLRRPRPDVRTRPHLEGFTSQGCRQYLTPAARSLRLRASRAAEAGVVVV